MGLPQKDSLALIGEAVKGAKKKVDWAQSWKKFRVWDGHQGSVIPRCLGFEVIATMGEGYLSGPRGGRERRKEKKTTNGEEKRKR